MLFQGTWLSTKEHPSCNCCSMCCVMMTLDHISRWMLLFFFFLMFDMSYCLTCCSGYLYTKHKILCQTLQSFMYLLPMIVLFILLLWPYVSHENTSNALSITLMPKQMYSVNSRYISLVQRPLWPHNILLLPCTRVVANCFRNCTHQNNHFIHLMYTDRFQI